jgi:hypothetical protein
MLVGQENSYYEGEPTRPSVKLFEDVGHVGSFLWVLLPTLFREGPHLKGKLLVDWPFWPRAL